MSHNHSEQKHRFKQEVHDLREIFLQWNAMPWALPDEYDGFIHSSLSVLHKGGELGELESHLREGMNWLPLEEVEQQSRELGQKIWAWWKAYKNA